MSFLVRKPGIRKPGGFQYPNLNHPYLQNCVGAFYFVEGAGAPFNLVTGKRTSIVGPDVNWATGPDGRTIDFQGDNDNDRVDIGTVAGSDPLSFSDTNQCTIITRLLYETPGNSFPRIIDKSTAGSGADGWAFYYETGGRLPFSIDGGNIRPTVTLTSGSYYTLAAVVRGGGGSTGRYRLLIDGLLDSETSFSANFPSASASCAIGNWNHSTDRNWKGCIDYVLLFNRALTDGEVITIGKNPYAPFERRIWVPVQVEAAAGSTASPTAGSASFEGTQSTIFAHKAVAPTTGDASFAGIAPTISAVTEVSTSPGLGAASFAGIAPTISAITGVSASPGLGSASFAGAAPVIFRATFHLPTTGTASFAGTTPTILLPGQQSPGVGTASFEGLAPTTSVFINLLPTTGGASFEGIAPTAAGLVPGTVSPTVGDMALTGLRPTTTVGAVFGQWNDITRASDTWTDITRASDTWTDI